MKSKNLGLLLIASFATITIAQERVEHAPITVDLTLPALAEQVPTSTGRGVPGFSNLSPMILLPVNLKVESLQKTNVGGKPGVNVLLIVQNLSEKEFELPIGRATQAITADNRTGRKEFAFLLRALCDKCDRRQVKTVIVTASASSLPNSYIVLKPRDRAYVKLFIDTGSYALGPGETALDIQLGCRQTEFEDGRYVIKNTSTIAWLDLNLPTPHGMQSSQAK